MTRRAAGRGAGQPQGSRERITGGRHQMAFAARGRQTRAASGPAPVDTEQEQVGPRKVFVFDNHSNRQRSRTIMDRTRLDYKTLYSGLRFRMDTERPSPRYSGIDLWEPADVLDAMIEGQFAAVAAAREARFALETAVAAIEARLKHSGRLVYVGAGTSGRLAVQDGAELVPTFNWPQDRLLLLIAGGRG